jgi:hypothetical protein
LELVGWAVAQAVPPSQRLSALPVRHMLYILIATIWLSVLTLVLSLCMIAAGYDAAGALSEEPYTEPRANSASDRAAFE